MFSSETLSAIARIGLVVLLNGLWQGALIAFVTWAAMQAFKGVNAATRYAVWSLALLAILVVPVATSLSRVTIAQPAPHVIASIAKASSEAVTPSSTARFAPVKQSIQPVQPAPADARSTRQKWFDAALTLIPRAQAFCVGLNPLIFMIAFGLWFLTALVIVVRLIVAFVQLERLKRDSLPLSVEYRDSMPRWSSALKGDRDVRICVSEGIEVPIAVGLFDSMVLLPSHLVHQLESEEIDQISLHELCHLLRGDDWTNALQRIAAGLLFFNPALWFVSRQMDVEREVACDDYVLQLTGAVRPYALCLTKMAEMTAWPHRALAAPGVFVTRKNISIRIERLLRTGRAIGSSIAPNAAATVTIALIAVFLVLRTMTPSVAFSAPDVPDVPGVTTASLPAAPVKPEAVAQQRIEHTVQEEVQRELSAVPKLPVPKVPGVHLAPPPHLHVAKVVAMTESGCTGCNFGGADLSGRDFSNHSMEGSNFDRATLRNAKFDRANLTGSNFDGADLRGASFVDADMEGCNLRNARLDGVNFEGARMTGCNINVAGLSPQQARTILNNCEGCNFERANLSGMDLHGVHLTGTNLEHANLKGANLAGVMFTGVNLGYADLSGANVNGADFTGCNFDHVDLHGVDLARASLTGSDMAHAIWH